LSGLQELGGLIAFLVKVALARTDWEQSEEEFEKPHS